MYACSFCAKLFKTERNACNHENSCKNNPANNSPCFTCHHCDTEPEFYELQNHPGSLGISNSYICKKFSKRMFTVRAKAIGLLQKHPNSFIGKEEMPKTCDSYKERFQF